MDIQKFNWVFYDDIIDSLQYRYWFVLLDDVLDNCQKFELLVTDVVFKIICCDVICEGL